jgi:flagellar biosynthesis chaperone FliJ
MTKIVEDDLKEINDLRLKISKSIGEAGQAILQIQMLRDDITKLEKKIAQESETFQKLIDEEQQLVKRLSEKYGTGSIDFETGEFTPEK